jgi:hypothetical protein
MSAKVVRTSAMVLMFGVLIGAAAAWWRGRSGSVPPTSPPEWPPIRPTTEQPTWVPAPGDGSTPDGFPVKVKVSSGIFHVPGGRFYDRTGADRCYATADAAEADGYRQSKS